jgi:hypothetical protein
MRLNIGKASQNVLLLPPLKSFNFAPVTCCQRRQAGLYGMLLLRASRNGHFKYGGQTITLKKL